MSVSVSAGGIALNRCTSVRTAAAKGDLFFFTAGMRLGDGVGHPMRPAGLPSGGAWHVRHVALVEKLPVAPQELQSQVSDCDEEEFALPRRGSRWSQASGGPPG